MGEIGRELCGLGRIPNNSLMVVCGDGVVVVSTDMHNVATVDDVMTVDDVVAMVGVAVAVDVWMQQ